MKRTIFLKLGYETGPTIRDKVLKQFRKDMIKFPNITIIKEFEPKAAVNIEFQDESYQDVYEALCKLDVVEMIDPQVLKDEKQIITDKKEKSK